MIPDQKLLFMQRKLADRGLLIAAGFLGFRIGFIPRDAGGGQVEDMRMAFMAGAQHLFASIIGILDPGSEPTAADMARMDLIDKELAAVAVELKQRVKKDEGNGTS